MSARPNILKSSWLGMIGCFILGAATVAAIRYFTYTVDAVHYHANFAVYINGQRETFKGAQYYADVEMCTQSTAMVPSERAHMHDAVNSVVHVEDHAVTWGQFFANLGWTLGPSFIAMPDGTIYAESGPSKLNLILNGQNYTDFGGLNNAVIKDQDRLLVSYGADTAVVLNQEYTAIPKTAAQYDTAKDPASCSGSAAVTVRDRLTHIF